MTITGERSNHFQTPQKLRSADKVAIPVLFVKEKDRPKHTEGALWDIDKKVLYGVDIIGKKVFEYSPSKEEINLLDVPEHIGTVVPTKTGELLVALQSGLGIINPKTESFTWKVRFNNNLKIRSNDGKCSPEGRFWFGTMGYKPNDQQKEGSLYRLDPDYSLTTVLDRSVTISNGIVWNKKGDKMFYIDTPTSEVVEYNYDSEKGTILDRRVVIKAGEIQGYFDGATIDEEDKIWIALWGGGGVGRYDPISGKLIDFVKTPGANQVSSCSFGGNNLDELYITTSREGLRLEDLDQQPMAGAVFKVKLPIRGLPAYKFG